MNKNLLPKLSAGQWFWLVSLGLAFDLWWINRAPSEEAMAQTFFEHRREFEEMRDLAQKQAGPDADLREPRDTAERERVARIRSLAKQLGGDSPFFFRGHPTQLRLETFGGGFTDTTWGIGYAYSATPLSPVVTSAYGRPQNREHQHFARLDGGWYIYHRR